LPGFAEGLGQARFWHLNHLSIHRESSPFTAHSSTSSSLNTIV
jgi:hypothetical protein